MPNNPETLFSPDPAVRAITGELYSDISGLPIVSPHGHVHPGLFSEPEAAFGSPVDLFILPDHYIIGRLYSAGFLPESLGISKRQDGWKETDHRAIWRIFCQQFHTFRASPISLWIQHELETIFDVRELPTTQNADRLYDDLSAKLILPEFQPRRLFERLNIQVLCTTDAPSDDLHHHKAILRSGWGGRIIPCLRMDGIANLNVPEWKANLLALENAVGFEITTFPDFIRAIEARRAFFKEMGAVATDHSVRTPFTIELSPNETETIFQHALQGGVTQKEALLFSGHMLMQSARMSVEDGLVMQLHAGIFRDHDLPLFERYGHDIGGDFPVRCEFTRNLRALLNKFGSDPRLTLVLFTLDETCYARELAPLAGHYPAIRIGPPWWFNDSPTGMQRYLEQVVESAGLQRLAGFNDDTRAFCSIPARHEMWRRSVANWLGGLTARHLITLQDAHEMASDLAVNLARRTYHL